MNVEANLRSVLISLAFNFTQILPTVDFSVPPDRFHNWFPDSARQFLVKLAELILAYKVGQKTDHFLESV